MEDYLVQENAHHYSSLEKLLKDGIPAHFNREKQTKTTKVITILSSCLAIVFLTLTFALQVGILSIFGGVSLVTFIGVLFKHVSNSTKVKIYNMALDIFDAYTSFNINVKSSTEILKTFKENEISTVCEKLVDLANVGGGGDNITVVTLTAQ